MHWSEADLSAYLQRQRQDHGGDGTQKGEAENLEVEKRFQARVLCEAKRLGWLAYFTADSRRSPEGFPDLVLLKPPTAHTPAGRLIVAELKTSTGKLTAKQQEWIRSLQTVRGIGCYVWRPAQFDDICCLLAEERPTP